MTYQPGWLALLAVVVLAAGGTAQIPIRPIPVWPRGPGVGIGVSVRPFGYPYYSYPYFRGYSYTSISIYSPPVVVVAPVVVNNPAPQAQADPVALNPNQPVIADPLVIKPKAQQPAVAAMDDAPLPGAPAGKFRPIAPEERAAAAAPAPVQPRPAKRQPPPLPQPRAPDPDPKIEYAWLIALGREAFAAQEYGRATQRFRQATALVPNEQLAHFLLAQAEFALGKYREAVVAIHAGMRRQRDWPTTPFRPRDLYGANAADYDEHGRRLQAAVTGQPNDPVLLFLYAYQLWFDGRRDDALPLFRKALPLVADSQFIEWFLEAKAAPLLAGA